MSVPNFTGTWRSCGCENLSAFLLEQGIPASNIDRAVKNNQSIKQSIRQTNQTFTVTVNDVVTAYSIVSGPPSVDQSPDQSPEDEPADAESIAALLTNNTMGWLPVNESTDESTSNEWKLIVLMLGEGRSTERRLIDGKMQIVNELNGVRAVNWFEREIEQ